jgi:hypothetical protein
MEDTTRFKNCFCSVLQLKRQTDRERVPGMRERAADSFWPRSMTRKHGGHLARQSPICHGFNSQTALYWLHLAQRNRKFYDKCRVWLPHGYSSFDHDEQWSPNQFTSGICKLSMNKMTQNGVEIRFLNTLKLSLMFKCICLKQKNFTVSRTWSIQLPDWLEQAMTLLDACLLYIINTLIVFSIHTVTTKSK